MLSHGQKDPDDHLRRDAILQRIAPHYVDHVACVDAGRQTHWKRHHITIASRFEDGEILRDRVLVDGTLIAQPDCDGDDIVRFTLIASSMARSAWRIAS